MGPVGTGPPISSRRSASFQSLPRPTLTLHGGPERISSGSLVGEGCTHSSAGAWRGDSEVVGPWRTGRHGPWLKETEATRLQIREGVSAWHGQSFLFFKRN